MLIHIRLVSNKAYRTTHGNWSGTLQDSNAKITLTDRKIQGQTER